MNKRLEMLSKLVQSGAADAFAHYAYALELKKEGRIDDAVAAFSALREKDASYLPQYLMAGQMLLDEGKKEEARPWLELGLALARSQGNGQAAGELEGALAQC